MGHRTVIESQVDGYVSCMNPRCPGYEQRPVQVIRENVVLTYRELGGDGNMPDTAVERESVYIRQTDATCEHCNGPVILSDQERPEYAQVSGQDQMALLNLNQQKQVHEIQLAAAQQGQLNAELRAQLTEQGKVLAEMQGEMQRRRGGRPRKEGDEE